MRSGGRGGPGAERCSGGSYTGSMASPAPALQISSDFRREVELRLGRAAQPLELEVLAALTQAVLDAEALGVAGGVFPARETVGGWMLAWGAETDEAWGRLGALPASALGLASEGGAAREAAEGFALGAGLPWLEVGGDSGATLALGLLGEAPPVEGLDFRLVRLAGKAEEELGRGSQARALAGLELIPAEAAAMVAWAHRHGRGLEASLGPDPRRDWGYALVAGDQEAALREQLSPWGIHVHSAGGLTKGNQIRLHRNENLVLDLPLELELGSLPAPCIAPGGDPEFGPARLPGDLREEEVEGSFLQLVKAQLGRVLPEATLLIREGAESPALCGIAKPGWTELDPFWGGAALVAEAARGLACIGAEALGVAIALPWNADPQLLLGVRQACASLGLPVLEARRLLGLDAPWVAALGTVEAGAAPVDVKAPEARGLVGVGPRRCGLEYRLPFDGLFLLGTRRGELGGSRILDSRGGRDACPEPWLDEAHRLHACVREGVRLGLVRSAHGVGRGGLLVAALEGSLASGLGCQLLLAREGLRLDALCFGEAPGRVLVSVGGEGEGALRTLARTHGVPFTKVGVVGGERFLVAVDGVPLVDAALSDLLPLP